MYISKAKGSFYKDGKCYGLALTKDVEAMTAPSIDKPPRKTTIYAPTQEILEFLYSQGLTGIIKVVDKAIKIKDGSTRSLHRKKRGQ